MTKDSIEMIEEKVSKWPKRIPGTSYGCVVLLMKEDYQFDKFIYRKGEKLCIKPKSWDNRTAEHFWYAGNKVPLNVVEFINDQRIPEHLKVEA